MGTPIRSDQERQPRPAGELRAGEEVTELGKVRARYTQHRRQPDNNAYGDQRKEPGNQIVGPTSSEAERQPRVREAFLGDPTSHDHRRNSGRESNRNLHQRILQRQSQQQAGDEDQRPGQPENK
jgi:hypothetical protein